RRSIYRKKGDERKMKIKTKPIYPKKIYRHIIDKTVSQIGYEFIEETDLVKKHRYIFENGIDVLVGCIVKEYILGTLRESHCRRIPKPFYLLLNQDKYEIKAVKE
ncbi:MAG: hypothetical protein D6707_07350, partial [Bacteroidetes bacterium]